MFSPDKRVLLFTISLGVLLFPQAAFCEWPDTGNKQIDKLFLESERNYSYEIHPLSLFHKALAIDPNCAPVYLRRAMYFERYGEYDKAIKDCNTALSLRLKDAEIPIAYHIKARALLQSGKYRKAIACVKKAGSFGDKLYSEERDDQRVIGASLYHLGKYKEAIIPLTSGLRNKINSRVKSADAYYYRGLCYYKLGELENALADLESAIKIAPSRPQYYSTRAKVLRKSGKIDLAKADERKAKTMKKEKHWLFYDLIVENKNGV